jgi:hypothetical protein
MNIEKSDTEIFNSLPFEVREACSNLETVARIRDLERQKVRLKENYIRERTFINEKIKSLKRWVTKKQNIT